MLFILIHLTTLVKDFVYDDAFVDKNDTYKHSKWLLWKRLLIAQKLLSETGVILISIDDNECSF